MDDKTITSYLLGESTAEEQKYIEERYFSDPDLLDQVLAVEDDLIDAYVRHKLTAPEHERFETYFLASPDRRDKVETAEALLTSLQEASGSKPAHAFQTLLPRRPFFGFLRPARPALRWALAAVLLVAVAGCVWLLVEKRLRRPQPDRAQLEETHQQREAQPLQQQLATQEAQKDQAVQKREPETAKQEPVTRSTSKSAIASFILTPGLTRDVEGINKLGIPRGAQFVKLQLSIESKAEYVNYQVSLQRVGMGEIWHHKFQSSGVAANKEALTITLPVNLFGRGEYLLSLNGTTATGETETVGDYPFIVEKQR